MKNIFAVCFYYPPLNSSEGYSAYKLFNKSKHYIHIYSQDNNRNWTYSKDKFENKQNVKYLDSNNFFNNVYDELLKKKIDVIITRSMPEESHNVGLKLKKINKDIKWICFFSDPLFFQSPISKWEHYYNQKQLFLKKQIFKIFIFEVNFWLKFIKSFLYWNKIKQKSDFMIYNNSYFASYVNAPKSKVVILPHCYKKINFNNINKDKNKIIFTFLGNVSRCRNLDNYLLAINEINDLKISKKAQFNFFGVKEKELGILNKKKNVYISKSISYYDSLNKMKESDWLINSDAHIQKYVKNYIYLPCKIIDYFSITNNILNITNFKNGATIDLTNELNGINVEDNVDKIKECILKILQKQIKNNLTNNDKIKYYEDENIASFFDKLI